MWQLIVVLLVCSIRTVTRSQTDLDFSGQAGHYRDVVTLAQQRFGIQCLQHQISETTADDNVIISPLSLGTALAMIMAGSRGRTLQELRTKMGLPQDKLVDLLRGHRGLKERVKKRMSSPHTRITMVNRLFLADHVQPKRHYTGLLRRFFHTEPARLDFGDQQRSARLINQAVSDATAGQIGHIVEPGSLHSDTLLVLLSVIQLEAEWRHAFDPGHTVNSTFQAPHGPVTVAMMRAKGHFAHGYIEKLKSRIIILPYKNSTLSMVVLLPSNSTKINNVIDLLTQMELADVISAANRTGHMEVRLPKFHVKRSYDMKHVLHHLGIRRAFSPEQAELGSMTDQPVYVSSVLHSTAISVAENGTTASAATGATVSSRTLHYGRKFTVNRPFLLLLADTNKSGLLFIGRVMNPTGANTTAV